MSDIYLSLTETPTVVTLSQPVVSGVLSSNVTVTNVVSVNVVTMPAINVTAAAPTVTTVAGTVTVSNLGLVPSSVATDGTADGTLNFVKIGGHQSGSNQTAHIVHVSAGGAMSVDATDSVVSISNFPSTQTIAGTVTANLVGWDGGNLENVRIGGYSVGEGNAGRLALEVIGVDGNPLSISGTVTANCIGQKDHNDGVWGGKVVPVQIIRTDEDIAGTSGAPLIVAFDTNSGSTTVTVSNSVTIGSIPAISGTVTANLNGYSQTAVSYSVSSVTAIPVALQTNGIYGGTLLAYNGANTYLRVGLDSVGGNSLAFGGSVPISGTVTANGSKSWTDPNSVVVNDILAVGGWDTTNGQFAPIPLNDGATAIQITQDPASAFIVIANSPAGTVSEASTQSITTGGTHQQVFASNSSRKYLLIQNISDTDMYLGLGFNPSNTTPAGLLLAKSGGGIVFESSYIPTSEVRIVCATTGKRFVALQG